jgi:hypothetical protein
MITMNSAGRIMKIIGNRSFVGIFCACSSARCRRLFRSSFDWARSTLAIDTPNRSAWTIASTNARSSSTSVRSPTCRKASARETPSWISWSRRPISSASGPGTLRITCAIAASNPRPASTLIVSRSSVSESVRRMSC